MLSWEYRFVSSAFKVVVFVNLLKLFRILEGCLGCLSGRYYKIGFSIRVEARWVCKVVMVGFGRPKFLLCRSFFLVLLAAVCFTSATLSYLESS